MADPAASLQSLTLDLPPSCIEFCPAHPDYFCVGTYSLVEDEARAQGDTSRPQNRNGSIVLFRTEGTTLRCIETIAQPSAILDLHFQQSQGRQDVFAVASSTASLSILRLTPSALPGHSVELVSVARVDGVEEDVLFLSCAWHPSIPDLVAVSTSTGAVYVMALNQAQQCIVVSKTAILTHELETWTVAFSPFTPKLAVQTAAHNEGEGGEGESEKSDGRGGSLSTTLYSGGDDSYLQYTSCVLSACPPFGNDAPLQTPFGTCKLTGHNAGVTAILPALFTNTDGGHIVVTGSYDDRIRVYSILDPVDTGGIRRTTCLAEQDLGGGVWRLKLISHAVGGGCGRWSMRVLASCMHAGARVIDIDGDVSGGCQISVAARFEEHKSMNYGSDFQQKESLVCVSTSFYDKLLCIWEVRDR